MSGGFSPVGGLAIVVVVLSAAAAGGGEGMVALQTADPACPDESGNRYVDCGNGTVTDNQSGLVWLANADCIGRLDWYQAMAAVASLADLQVDGACNGLTTTECDCGLSDGSSPGEWRLATVSEWEAMIADAQALGCSRPITNDAGDACWDEACVTARACSFLGLAEDPAYWSASLIHQRGDAWMALLRGGGSVLGWPVTQSAVAWPVRGGQ